MNTDNKPRRDKKREGLSRSRSVRPGSLVLFAFLLFYPCSSVSSVVEPLLFASCHPWLNLFFALSSGFSFLPSGAHRGTHDRGGALHPPGAFLRQAPEALLCRGDVFLAGWHEKLDRQDLNVTRELPLGEVDPVVYSEVAGSLTRLAVAGQR
jgi:hypothetical protein